MTKQLYFGRSSFVLRPANKKTPPRIGTKDCFVVPPKFILDFRLWIFDCVCGNPKSEIQNLKSLRLVSGPTALPYLPMALRKRLRGGVAWLLAEHARSRWRALPEGCGRATCPRQRSICICSPNHSTRNRSRQVGNWVYSLAALARLTAVSGRRTLPIMYTTYAVGVRGRRSPPNLPAEDDRVSRVIYE